MNVVHIDRELITGNWYTPITRFRNIYYEAVERFSRDIIEHYTRENIDYDLYLERTMANVQPNIISINKKYNKPNNLIKYKILREIKSKCSCSICYEEYKPNDSLYVLECGHDFCCKCLDEWIKSKNPYITNFDLFYYGRSNTYNQASNQIDYSKHECPYCRQNIKNNTIFNTGLIELNLRYNFIRDIIKLNKYQDDINEYLINVSKEYLIKLYLLEYIVAELKNNFDINDFTTKKKKDKIKKTNLEKFNIKLEINSIIHMQQKIYTIKKIFNK